MLKTKLARAALQAVLSLLAGATGVLAAAGAGLISLDAWYGAFVAGAGAAFITLNADLKSISDWLKDQDQKDTP